MKKAPGRCPGAFWLLKKSKDFFNSQKNFFDCIEKVSDCTRKGGSPPPFHTFPPLPVQRIFSFFDTLKPPDLCPGAFSAFYGRKRALGPLQPRSSSWARGARGLGT